MDSIVPPFNDVAPSEIAAAAEATAPGTELRLRVAGLDQFGSPIEFVAPVTMPEGATGDEKLQAAGITLREDGDKVIIDFDHAEGGLVVAGTAYNAVERHENSTGFADPKIIPDGDAQVKLFFVAGEDRIWHPATMTIDGAKVIVRSPAVAKPCGVSYGTGEVGWQPWFEGFYARQANDAEGPDVDS